MNKLNEINNKVIEIAQEVSKLNEQGIKISFMAVTAEAIDINDNQKMIVGAGAIAGNKHAIARALIQVDGYEDIAHDYSVLKLEKIFNGEGGGK